MTERQAERPFRLLMMHSVLWALGMSLACGFVDAYFLRQGFSMAGTLCLHAALLLVRFCIRGIILPLVRRLGMHHAMKLGAGIAALQFLPLIRAEEPIWLAAWIAIVAIGECIYWPIFHAATAVCGGHGKRGRQIALRQIANTLVSVFGPFAGGAALTQFGSTAEFATASMLTLLSLTPLFWIDQLHLGSVPGVRQSVTGADRVGMIAFAADGWICAGTSIAWPMVLFTSLDSSYTALGCASSIAGIAGALAGLGCGLAIDRGYRQPLSRLITLALVAGILLRAASAWAPWAALVANALAAAISGLYVPLLMSVIYDRAKRSGSAYQFHLSAEAGWDAGCVLGCLAAALVASTTLPATLTVLPATLGVLLIHRCVRGEPVAAIRCEPALALPVMG